MSQATASAGWVLSSVEAGGRNLAAWPISRNTWI